MGRLYINPKQQLDITSSWYAKPGGMIIHLTTEGDYVYGNGKPVINKLHFASMSGQDRANAVAWFEKKFGTLKVAEDTGETHATPIETPTEPDLDAEVADIPDEVV